MSKTRFCSVVWPCVFVSRSFCPDHSPTQSLCVSSDLSLPQSCSICLDSIEPVLSYSILKCPSCHASWFHRDCVQVRSVCSPHPADIQPHGWFNIRLQTDCIVFKWEVELIVKLFWVLWSFVIWMNWHLVHRWFTFIFQFVFKRVRLCRADRCVCFVCQRQAHSAGLFFFRCTLCNNKENFQEEMLRMGIYIPER